MSPPKRLTSTVAFTTQPRWHLDVPTGPPPPGGWRLLVGLHGYGEDGARIAERLPTLADAPYARLWPDGPFPVEVPEAPPTPAPTDSAAAATRRMRVGAAWYQYTGDQPAFLKALDVARAYLADVVDAAVRTAAADQDGPTLDETVALRLRPSRLPPPPPQTPGPIINRAGAVLLGYSQGGYLAGVAALRDRTRWAGLVAIACRVKTEALADVMPATGYPVLLIHGTHDASTSAARQREAHEYLLAHGVDSTFLEHAGGHGLRKSLGPPIDAFARRVFGLPPLPSVWPTAGPASLTP